MTTVSPRPGHAGTGVAADPADASADSPRRAPDLVEDATALGLAWRTMRRSRSAIVAHSADDVGGLRLEVGDVETLDQIASAEGQAQMSDLADEMGVAPSTITKAVDRLVAKGLAARQQDPDDGRVYRVALTEAGERAHATARDRRVIFVCRVLERFSPEDREAIGRLMPLLACALAAELGLHHQPLDPAD